MRRIMQEGDGIRTKKNSVSSEKNEYKVERKYQGETTFEEILSKAILSKLKAEAAGSVL